MLDLSTHSTEAIQTAREALQSIHGSSPEGVALKLQNDNQLSEVKLPTQIMPILLEILAQMANGNGIQIVPVQAELTTQQAADILNVSRPYLIKLLEEGNLPFHRVGTHRRVRLHDLLHYRTEMKIKQEEGLQILADEAQQLGLGYE